MFNNLTNKVLEKPLIAVDLDDVIFDCNGTLQVILIKEFGFSGTFSDFIKLNPNMVTVAFEFLYGKYHQDSLIAEGSFEALSSIAAFYKMAIITSRSETVREQTNKWLESNFPGLFKEIHFTNNFLASEGMVKIEKHEICANLDIQIIIEDSHEVAVNAASNNMKVLLIDRPWNREVPQHPNIYRAKGWKDVHELLLKSHRNRSAE